MLKGRRVVRQGVGHLGVGGVPAREPSRFPVRPFGRLQIATLSGNNVMVKSHTRNVN